MKTYVSIDLDYWSMHSPYHAFKRLWQQVRRSGCEISVVLEHHALLRDPRLHEARHLVNFDQHDDVCAEVDPGQSCCCGTWVTFVPWAKQGQYTWVYPQKGRTLGDVWDGICDPDWVGWSAHHVYGRARRVRRVALDWSNVIGVGIAISPDFLYGPAKDLYEEKFAWLFGDFSGLVRRWLSALENEPFINSFSSVEPIKVPSVIIPTSNIEAHCYL